MSRTTMGSLIALGVVAGSFAAYRMMNRNNPAAMAKRMFGM
jgi:uncharacterized membrane protein YebE (DUF533 family)